jgi:hypothetical protein
MCQTQINKKRSRNIFAKQSLNGVEQILKVAGGILVEEQEQVPVRCATSQS